MRMLDIEIFMQARTVLDAPCAPPRHGCLDNQHCARYLVAPTAVRVSKIYFPRASMRRRETKPRFTGTPHAFDSESRGSQHTYTHNGEPPLSGRANLQRPCLARCVCASSARAR